MLDYVIVNGVEYSCAQDLIPVQETFQTSINDSYNKLHLHNRKCIKFLEFFSFHNSLSEKPVVMSYAPDPFTALHIVLELRP